MGRAGESLAGRYEGASVHSLSGARLTLAEVREAGRTAFFLDYGEALLYADDELFEVREIVRARTAGLRPTPLPAQVLRCGVGLEYGWRHAGDCDCRACAQQVAGAGRIQRPAALALAE